MVLLCSDPSLTDPTFQAPGLSDQMTMNTREITLNMWSILQNRKVLVPARLILTTVSLK